MSRHSRKAVLEYLAIGIAIRAERRANLMKITEPQIVTLQGVVVHIKSQDEEDLKEEVIAVLMGGLIKKDLIQWESKSGGENPEKSRVFSGTLKVVKPS